MRRLLCLSATIISSVYLVPSSPALTPAQTKAIRRAILSVPAPELPSKAVELVNQAAPADQTDVALAALRTAIYKHRTSAPHMVAALSKALPNSAGIIAKTAAAADGNQAGEIASAALTAAPGSRSDIISSVNSGYNSSIVFASSYTPAGMSGSTSAGGKLFAGSPGLSAGSLDLNTPGDELILRSSDGHVPGGEVHNSHEPINPGPDPSHHHFHGPPPWAAGPGHEVDYSKPRRR